MSTSQSIPRQQTSDGNDQPYSYVRQDRPEPDWRRFPGWRDVCRAGWESAQWQRAHCIKKVSELRGVLGDLVPECFYTDMVRDQDRYATMPLLLPPQMLNTIVPDQPPPQRRRSRNCGSRRSRRRGSRS